MSSNTAGSTEDRVLVYSPTERDTESTVNALSDAGFGCRACPTLDSLTREMEAGAGALLLHAEQADAQPTLQALQAELSRQEPWSDLPLILLVAGGLPPHSILAASPSAGALLLLEHPAPLSTLVSAVRTALHARHCQYQIRDLQYLLETEQRQNTQFVAMLAHELRNPLAPLSNAVQLMRMRGEPDAATARFRDVVERQVRHMQRMVDDLLDVSRLTRRMIELRRARLDLAYLVRQTVEEHENELTATGLTLSVEAPQEPVWIDGDAARLTQVLGNLLHQSAALTPAGGHVTVRLQTEECEPLPGVSPISGSCAVVTIQDTGAGMEPDHLPHLFDGFALADHGRECGGGLGLILVKQLVELHQGQVSAASEGPGRGLEFTVRLPLGAAVAESVEQRVV